MSDRINLAELRDMIWAAEAAGDLDEDEGGAVYALMDAAQAAHKMAPFLAGAFYSPEFTSARDALYAKLARFDFGDAA